MFSSLSSLFHVVLLSWLLGSTAERVASRGRPSAGAGNLGTGSLSHRVGALKGRKSGGGRGEVGISGGTQFFHLFDNLNLVNVA